MNGLLLLGLGVLVGLLVGLAVLTFVLRRFFDPLDPGSR